jgi:hypothetical protein
MHLLDTSTITLSLVNSDRPPAYAILSHRWDESELSFQDIKDGINIQNAGIRRSQVAARRLLKMDGSMSGLIRAV